MSPEGVRDEPRFDALINECEHDLLAMLVQVLHGDVATARELAQDAVETAWKEFDQAPGNERDPFADIERPEQRLRLWLLRIAMNKVRNHQRYRWVRQRPYPRSSAAGPRTMSDRPSEDVIIHNMDLSNALSRLSQTDQKIVLLAHYHNLTSQEIAEVLGGISAVAVRQRLRRACLKIRLTLGTDYTKASHGDERKSRR